MRLLIVGSTASWAIERHYVRYLSQMDIILEVFDPSKYFDLSIYNRLLLRIGSLLPFNAANAALIRAAERFRPDVIWIFKGVEFKPETLQQLKRRGIKLANYNPDHPYIRTSISHGGKNVEDCVPLYDLHFCYSRDLAQKIEKEYNIQTAWLPFGYELDGATFDRVRQYDEIHRVGFVGNPDRLRARIVRQLADAGLSVDVYGFGWRQYLSGNKNIKVFDAALGDMFWKKLRQYRVQLNIFRPHNTGSHNMRTFEIPAVGGIMLAPDSPEHRAFFSHGTEAFFYQTENEIEGYCKELLAMGSVDYIRENALRKSHEGEYSYEKRATTVCNVFQETNWIQQAGLIRKGA